MKLIVSVREVTNAEDEASKLDSAETAGVDEALLNVEDKVSESDDVVITGVSTVTESKNKYTLNLVWWMHGS